MGDPIPFRELFSCPLLRLQSSKQSSLRGDSHVRVEIDIRGIVVREDMSRDGSRNLSNRGLEKKL